MGQTTTLPLTSVVPISTGLCRSSPVPAESWSFPTLSLQSLYRCLVPYPAAPLWCVCSLLPKGQRPHLREHRFGALNDRRNATSTTGTFSRLQTFHYVQAPILARPPDCTHRYGSNSIGRPGRLHHAWLGWLPAPRCGIATCPTRAIDTAGLSPAGLQPCRLLRSPKFPDYPFDYMPCSQTPVVS